MAFQSFDRVLEDARSRSVNKKPKPSYYSAQEIVDYIDQVIAAGEWPLHGVPVDILGVWMEQHYADGKKLSYGRTSNRNALTDAMSVLESKVKRVHRNGCKLSWIVKL